MSICPSHRPRRAPTLHVKPHQQQLSCSRKTFTSVNHLVLQARRPRWICQGRHHQTSELRLPLLSRKRKISPSPRMKCLIIGTSSPNYLPRLKKPPKPPLE